MTKIMNRVSVGTVVSAIFESFDTNVKTQSYGKVVEIGGPVGQPHDFVATVLWDDGSSSSMSALFFFKTINIVERMAA